MVPKSEFQAAKDKANVSVPTSKCTYIWIFDLCLYKLQAMSIWMSYTVEWIYVGVLHLLLEQMSRMTVAVTLKLGLRMDIN
jgi:hypothetical protein